MARAWPDAVVEEGTLRVHISALRRALGEDDSGGHYIENVMGYGYRFVAPIRQHDATEEVAGCPFPLQRLIGRAGSISAVTAGYQRSDSSRLWGPEAWARR